MSIRDESERLLSLFLYRAAFLKERNPIAKNLVIVILILLRVHSIINLLQCRIARALQISKVLRVLCLKDGNAGIDVIVNEPVITAKRSA